MAVPTEYITNERLEQWKLRLQASNATPLVLIGVGHDQKSGELCVCIPTGIPDGHVANVLEGVARLLRGKK